MGLTRVNLLASTVFRNLEEEGPSPLVTTFVFITGIVRCQHMIPV